jgi:hypothetical protein
MQEAGNPWLAVEILEPPQVRISSRIINQDPPASSHPDIVGAVAASAKALGLSTKNMVSRAYHDSLFMARSVGFKWGVVPGRDVGRWVLNLNRPRKRHRN